jgi:hypothetical protein
MVDIYPSSSFALALWLAFTRLSDSSQQQKVRGPEQKISGMTDIGKLQSCAS